MLVHCEVRGSGAIVDEGVNGTRCSFYASAPVTLEQIERLFPFEGRFHFRQRVSGKSVKLANTESVWLDLTDVRKELQGPLPGQEALEILALALELPEVSEEESRQDAQQYLEEVAQEMPGLAAQNRPRRHKVEAAKPKAGMQAKLKQGAASVLKHISQAAQKTSLESVSSGVSSLWNSIAKQTRDIFTGGSVLSDQAEGNLAELSELLGQGALVSSDAGHVDLMRDLWECLFPRCTEPFALRSDKWKEAGFQGADPTADLKSTGLLAVRAMLHMGLSHPEKTQEVLQANRVNTKTKYPFAIVCVNITLLLAEILNLRDCKYMTTLAGYWSMFEEPEAFFDMFCICFFHMNATWVARQAVRADFGRLIGEIKSIAASTLARNPLSVMDFRMISIDEGMTS